MSEIFILSPLTISLPVFPFPSVYALHLCMLVISIASMCSRANTSNGECLAEWAPNNNLMLLHNPKCSTSFISQCWNTGSNPDMALASARPDNRLPHRCVLEKFPQSQHRPSLITATKLLALVPNKLVKQWDFHTAD